MLHPHASALVGYGARPKKVGNAHGSVAPYEVFQTGTGALMLAANNNQQFTRLVDELGRPELATDPRFGSNADRVANRTALSAIMTELVYGQDSVELSGRLIARGVPATAVLDVPEALSQPQASHREMVVSLPGYAALGIPVKLSRPGTGQDRAGRQGRRHRERAARGGLRRQGDRGADRGPGGRAARSGRCCMRTIGAGPGNAVHILFQGIGVRLACAPIGYCTVALIRTETGRTVLVDTGVHQTREMVLAGLREQGLTPDGVDQVVLTHLHFDHCENAGLFPSAEMIVHADEIAEARSHPDRDPYLADFWSELLDRCRVTAMTGAVRELDGGVRVHHLPGHRHGQLAVSVPTSEGRVVCCSDVAKNARELLLGSPPISDPAMADAARASVEWVRRTADIVVPGHDRVLTLRDTMPEWHDDQEILFTIY